MVKVIRNLSLDAGAARRGEQYSARHRTSLSRLVSDFLSHLPVASAQHADTPIVQRLRGMAKVSKVVGRRSKQPDETTYRDYLWQKYGH